MNQLIRKILFGFFVLMLSFVVVQNVAAQAEDVLIDETFDSSWTAKALPYRWNTRKITGTGSATTHWRYSLNATSGYNGTPSAYGTFTTTNKSGMLISPSITPQSDKILRFWYKATSTTAGKLMVCTSSDAQGNNIIDTLGTFIPQTANAWSYESCSLKGRAGQTFYIVFYVPDVTAAYSVHLDNVLVENYPGCQPAEFALTSDITQTTATLNWSYGVGNYQPALLNVQVVDTATMQSVFSNPTYDGTNVSVALTGLTAGHTYTATIAGDCSNHSSGTSALTSTTFTTLVDPVSLPIYTGFETGIPEGWSVNPEYPEGTTIYNATGTYKHSGAQSVKLNTAANCGQPAELLTPPLGHRINDIMLDFYVRSNALSSTPKHLIIMVVDSLATNQETVVDTLLDNATTYSQFKHLVIYLDSLKYFPTQAGCRVKFRVDQGTVVNTVYLDDITISAKPSCLRSEDLKVNYTTSTTAELSWTDQSTAPQYQVSVSSQGTVLDTLTVTTNPCTITGLQPRTEYSFMVRAVCGDGDTALFSLPASATTACAPSATLVEDFSGTSLPDCWEWTKIGGTGTLSGTYACVRNTTATTYAYGKSGYYYYVYGSTSTANYYDYLLTSKPFNVSTPGLYDLHFNLYRYYATGTSTYTAETKVWVNNHPDTVGAVLLKTIPYLANKAPVEKASGVYEYWGNIPISGEVYVMFEYTGYGYMYLDHIYLEQRPACRPVSDIRFDRSASDSTSVLLKWTADTETQWIVKYTLGNDSNAISDSLLVSGTPELRIFGLTPGTYFPASVTITSYCSETEQGTPVTASDLIARTDNPAYYPLPYNEDFETFTTDELGDGTFTIYPPVFTTATTPYGAASIGTVASTRPSGSNKNLKIGNSATSSTYLILPEFRNQSQGVKVNFYYCYYSYNANYSDTLRYGYMTSDSTFVTEGAFYNGNNTLYAANFTIDSLPAGAHIAFCYGGNYNSNNYAIYLDNINVVEKPKCTMIDFPVADSVSAYSARLVAKKYVANQWEVVYGVKGTPLDSCTSAISNVGDSTITLTGLSPYTEYDFYARQICNASDVSPWSGKRTFTTACAAYILTMDSIYHDTFEEFGTAKITGCYEQDNTTSSYYWRRNTTRSFDSDNSSIYGYGNEANGMPGLYRQFHLEAGHRYEIAAAQYGYSSTYTIDGVFVYGTSIDRKNMTEIGRIQDVPYQQWRHEKFYFVPAVTDDYYVGVYGEIDNKGTTTVFYQYMDTLTLRELSCIPPKFILVSDISTSSATIYYDNYSENCNIIVATDEQMTNIVCDTVVVADSSRVVFNGLTSGTRYYYQMRLLCSETDASEFLPVACFDTYCDAKNLPFVEGFESDADMICWTELDSEEFDRAANYRRSGASSMHMVKGNISSPEINVTSLSLCELSGYVLSPVAGTPLSIGASYDPLDPEAYLEMAEITIAEANKWQEFVIYFDGILDPEYPEWLNAKNISFVTTSENDLYFDDINVQLASDCRRPTNVVASAVTDSSVTLSWTANNSETAWLVKCGARIDTVHSKPAVISNLMGAVDYQFAVAALCDASASNYSSPLTVRTLCPSVAETPWFEDFESYPAQADLVNSCAAFLPANISGTTTYPYFSINTTASSIHNNGGARNLKINASKTTPAYCVLPVMDAPVTDLNLSFVYGNYLSNIKLSVGLMTDPNDPSTYWNKITLPYLSNTAATTRSAAPTVITFDSVPAGYQNAHIVFRQELYTSEGASYASYLDNVTVKQLRSCSDPLNVTVSPIFSTSATVTFTDSAAHNAWQYIIARKGENYKSMTPVSLSDTTFTLSGLDPETDYVVYVRAFCDSANQSNWISASFTTPATPVALPYVCGFESQASEWRTLQNAVDNYFIVGSDPAAVLDGTHALYVSDNGSDCHSASLYGTSYAYIPVEFNDAKYEINFDWLATGGYSTSSYGRAFIVPADFDLPLSSTLTAPTGFSATALPAAAIALDGKAKMSLTEGWQSHSNVIDMTDKAGAYKIVFYWRSYSSTLVTQKPLSIDNLLVREITCPMVDSIAAIDSLRTDSTLAFSFVNPGTTTEYRLSLSGSVKDYVASGVVTSSPLSLTGLSASQNYTVYMRNLCADNDSSPWTSASALTACGTVTAFPLKTGFEVIPENECWTMTNLTPTVSTSKWSTATTNVHSGTKSAKIAGSAGSSALITSPLIHFDGSREYHISFYMYNTTAPTYTDRLSFWLTPDSNSVDNGTKFFEETPYQSGVTAGTRLHEVDIPQGTEGDFYIGMLGEYISTGGYLYVDDLVIDIYPACRELSNTPTVDFIGDNFANMTMNDFHPSYQIAWAPAQGAVTDTAASLVTDLEEFTITGLTPGINYAFYARAFCNNGDTTAWVPFGSYATKSSSCFEPTKIRRISVTCDTAATFTWYHGSEATQFDYELIRLSDSVTVSGTVYSDTLTLGSLSVNVNYSLNVKVVCPDSTYVGNLRFKTTSLPTTVPYVCGFENDDENELWVFTNAKKNKLTIGSATAAVKNGSKALYVTDNTTPDSYSYTITAAGCSFASRIFNLDEGFYEISYDWKGQGESTFDYTRVFLLPASEAFTASNSTTIPLSGMSATTLPANAISLDGSAKLNLASDWQHFEDNAIDVEEGGLYNLVIAWRTDAATGTQPPFSIDNINFDLSSCPPLKSVSVGAADTFADAIIARRDSAAAIEYGVSLYNNVDSVATLYSVPAHGQFKDTVRINGLTPSTTYFLFSRVRCSDVDSSNWTVNTFNTIAEVTPLPYVCGFEAGETSGWYYSQTSQNNKWFIGSATAVEGQNSMYISSDQGASATYDVSSASVSFVTRTFYLAPGVYEFSYDWKAGGESTIDYLRVFMTDANFSVTPGTLPTGVTATALPAGMIALDGGSKLNLSTEWKNQYSSFRVTDPVATKLIFMWRNDGSLGNDLGACIDNINFSEITCNRITGVTVSDITTNSATLVLKKHKDESPVGYVVAYNDTNYRTTAQFDTIYNDTLELSDLNPSTRYFVWVKTLCSAVDESSWHSTYFETTCLPYTEFPFVEDFESGANFPYVCWKNTTVTPGTETSGGWEIIEVAATSTYRSSGTHYMRLAAAGGTTADNLLALPQMTFTAGKSYELAFNMYRLNSTTYNDNLLKVWIGPNKTGVAGNTLIGTYSPSASIAPVESEAGNYRYTVNIPDSISGSQYIVLEGRQGYSSTSYTYIYLDDIRVAEVVEAATYQDTVCGNYADYTEHGFNIAARDINSGLNNYTRRDYNNADADSIYHLNLYRFAPVNVYLYDTICRGEVYSKGYFQNLTDANTYQSSGLIAQTGCDSTVYLTLTVVDIEYNNYDTICQGDSVLFNNVWRKTSGTYSFDSINSRGCTETTYLHLVVETTFTEHSDTICQGDSVLFHNVAYRQTGVYDYTYSTPSGCPAIDRLNLEVVNTNPVIYDTICSGQSYTFGTQILTTSGVYHRTYVGVKGCDINEDLYLTVTAPIVVNYYGVACEGKPYYQYGVKGIIITQDTLVTMNSKTAEMCDSTTNVYLTFQATSRSEFSDTIKRGEMYYWGGSDLTEPGDYPVTFTSVDGCDSIVTLHLFVTTGIETVADINMTIVPNPVNAGATALVYGEFGEVENVEILNNFGQVIDRFTPASYPIEVNGIPASGLYYVRVITKSGSVHLQKLIVK